MSATTSPTRPTPPPAAATEAAAVRYLKSLDTARLRTGRRHLADRIQVAKLDGAPPAELRADLAALALIDRELAARAPGERVGPHAERVVQVDLSGEQLLADAMEGGPNGRHSHGAHPYAGSEL